MHLLMTEILSEWSAVYEPDVRLSEAQELWALADAAKRALVAWLKVLTGGNTEVVVSS